MTFIWLVIFDYMILVLLRNSTLGAILMWTVIMLVNWTAVFLLMEPRKSNLKAIEPTKSIQSTLPDAKFDPGPELTQR